MDELTLKIKEIFEEMHSIEENWDNDLKNALSKMDAIVNAVLNQERTPKRLRKKPKTLDTSHQYNSEEDSKDRISKNNLSGSQRPKRTVKLSTSLKERKLSGKLRQPVIVKLERLAIEEFKDRLSIISENVGKPIKQSLSTAKRDNEQNKEATIKIEQDKPRFKRITRQNSKDISTGMVVLNASSESALTQNSSIEIISENSIHIISEEDSEIVVNPKKDSQNKTIEMASTRITRSRIKREKGNSNSVFSVEQLDRRDPNTSRSATVISNRMTDKSSDEESFVSINNTLQLKKAVIPEEEPSEEPENDYSNKNEINNNNKNITLYEDVLSDDRKSPLIIDQVVVGDEVVIPSKPESIPHPVNETHREETIQNETFITGLNKENINDETFHVKLAPESTFVITEKDDKVTGNNIVILSNETFCVNKEERKGSKVNFESIGILKSTENVVDLLKKKQLLVAVPTKRALVPSGNNKVLGNVTKQPSKDKENILKTQGKKVGTPTAHKRLMRYETPELKNNKRGPTSIISSKTPSPLVKTFSNKKVHVLRSNNSKDERVEHPKSQQQQDGKKKEQLSKICLQGNKKKIPEGKSKNQGIAGSTTPAEKIEMRHQEDYLRRLEQNRLEIESKEKLRNNRELVKTNKIQEAFTEIPQYHLAEQNTSKSYNFDMLQSGDSTDDEVHVKSKRPPIPTWSKYSNRQILINRQIYLPTKVIDSFFSIAPLNPDLEAIFPRINPVYLKRNSSVVWNTPPRYSLMPKY